MPRIIFAIYGTPLKIPLLKPRYELLDSHPDLYTRVPGILLSLSPNTV